MAHARPVKYGRIWRNLPLRVKAGVCLFAPLPFIAAFVAILGFFRFPYLHLLWIPGAALELLAAAWFLEGLVASVRDLHHAAARAAAGEPLPELLPHSWEFNGAGRQIESLAAALDAERSAVLAAAIETRRMFDDAPLPYLAVSAAGVIERANRAAADLLGRSSDSLAGKSVVEALGASSAPLPEREYLRPDGQRRFLSIRHDALPQGGALYSLLDITDRQLAAEARAQVEREREAKDEEVAAAKARAVEAEEARTRFLSNMSDELRVPLNGIVGFAELMFDGKVGAISVEQRECLGDILASAHSLQQLIGELLDAANTDPAKPAEAPRETIDLEAAIQEVRYVIEVLASQKRRVQISVEIDPGLRRVPADAGRVKQLIQSYLLAAVKFSPKGGHVTARVLPEGRSAFRLEVEHNRPAAHDKGLEEEPRYFANDPALAAAKQLVEAQGGRVGLRSTHHGGIVFAVLPTAPGGQARHAGIEAAPAEPVPAADPAERLRRSLEVAGIPVDGRRAALVLGRDLATLPVMLSTLAAAGYRPVCLEDARSVLEAAGREQPAAVVVDLESAGPGEFEFVETALRSVGLATPVIGFRNGELTGAPARQAAALSALRRMTA